ncbi:MAG: M1 family metallopeptidase [Bacteroidetes bacterium]|nr:M1 family metallopeptidase [Bacteroidota bacterium]
MNKLYILFLLILFAGFAYVSELNLSGNSGNSNSFIEINPDNSKKYKTEYQIYAELNTDSKLLKVQENLIWRNLTDFSTNEIQFHLYANGFKNNKTLLNKRINVDDKGKTEIVISKLLVNGVEKELIYFQPDVNNEFDSTVAKVIIDNALLPGDSAQIYFEYEIRIPKSLLRFGYAEGRNFYFISQWFPKAGVFKEGVWTTNQFHPFTNFYSDFGKYDVSISVPMDYTVAATGDLINEKRNIDKKTLRFFQENVHDFVWMATDNILYNEKVLTKKDGGQLIVKTYVQPEKEKFIPRYFDAVKNSLEYFEKNIGGYPYNTISLVDVPRTSNSGGMEYPTFFTVSAPLFSPKGTQDPENVTVHEFSHQYFYGIVANNEVNEAWLDEGITSYFTTKILKEYYGEPLANFKFANYIPVYGFNFLTFEEIPIIYSINNIHRPEGSNALNAYYKNMSIGAIADTSFKIPFFYPYFVHANFKPELMLLSLERILGHGTMMKIFKEYFDTYKFTHAESADFINIVNKNSDIDLSWFWENVFENSRIFDYKVRSVVKNGNKYEVFVERLGDGIFKNEIALITETDTLYKHWDGKEKWKIVEFETKNKVYAGVIDHEYKNIMDINYANNSYTMEGKYWASLSLAVRWFFWVQNALMMLGSI